MSVFSDLWNIYKEYQEKKDKEKSIVKTKEIFKKLKSLDVKYWEVFMENYPTLLDGELPFSDKGLCDMSIEVKMLLTKLGETATKRMMYIGFDLVYPFDNHLDWYSWANNIRKYKISHEEYSDIAMRISSEIMIMQKYLKNGSWGNYNNLTEDIFSDGKEKSQYTKILALTRS